MRIFKRNYKTRTTLDMRIFKRNYKTRTTLDMRIFQSFKPEHADKQLDERVCSVWLWLWKNAGSPWYSVTQTGGQSPTEAWAEGEPGAGPSGTNTQNTECLGLPAFWNRNNQTEQTLSSSVRESAYLPILLPRNIIQKSTYPHFCSPKHHPKIGIYPHFTAS